MKRQIGLDFGTTTSVVTYRDYDEKNSGDVKPVMFDGTDYVPTLILKEGSITNKKGVAIHHEEAYGRDADNADRFHSLLKRNFKMDLISANSALQKEAQELTGKFFHYLYQQYSAKALEKKDAPITEISTVVTYPAKFPKDVQVFLKEAAEKAGFRNVKMLDESKAAMAFSLIYDTGSIKQYVHRRGKNKLKVLLIDMGAGTTDIAVFQYDVADPRNFEHLCSWPEKGAQNFGGREIDEKLCRFYQDKLGKEAIAQELFKNDPIVAGKLLTKLVKSFKDGTISPELAEKRTVTMLPGALQNIADDMDEDPDTNLNRASFEKLLKDYLPQFPELVNGALKKAGMTGKDVDLAILTGGHSQWYFVKDRLAELGISRDAIFGFSDPHLVVAQGAAWYVDPPKKDPKPVTNESKDTNGKENENAQTSGSKNTKASGKTTSGTQKPAHTITGHSQSGAKNNTSDSVLVKLNTSYGEEFARLSIHPQSKDVPVKIELTNRPFSHQFCPSTVRRDSGTQIVVTGYTDSFDIRFSSMQDAESWYKKLLPFIQDNQKTTSRTSSTATPVASENVFPLKYDPRNPLRPVIAANLSKVLAVKQDGRVLAEGTWTSETRSWTNIVSVAVDAYNTCIGLRSDGTVVSTDMSDWQNEIRDWRNIISITAGGDFIAGLHADGHVSIAAKKGFFTFYDNLIISKNWESVVSITTTAGGSGYSDILWGLKKDGTCISTEGYSRAYSDTAIVRGCQSNSPIVLKKSGKVLCSMKGCQQVWSDIIAVDGWNHLVGLKKDGKVVAVGPDNSNHKLDVTHWRNIIAIAAGRDCTIGLQADGRMVIAYETLFHGKNNALSKTVRTWKLF